MLADLSVNYVDLELRNPVVISPAGVTGTVRRMKKAEEAGCGAIVVKTPFEEEVTRRSPTPRFRVLGDRAGARDSFVLYSYEQASPFSPERYASEIARAKRELGIPVMASIGCMTDEGWRSYARLVEDAGADAVELNVSCPHAKVILEEGDVSRHMCDATSLVEEEISIPIVPKMTPQASNPLSVALELQGAGADGVVMFNRFTGLDIDIETEAPVMHGAFAGHGGPWSLHYVLRWLIATSPRVEIPIASSGGIWNGEDAAKAILAGATVTEICSVVVVQGYSAIGRIIRQLGEFMDHKGYSGLDEFRGNACDRLLATEEVDRRQTVRAVLDPDLCSSCGLCERICIYDAISSSGRTFRVKSSCQGCGLCVELCPEGAISMVPLKGKVRRKGQGL
jgi:dihydroorotate dehydrogenase (fumarate)